MKSKGYKKHSLSNSEVIRAIPLACSDETAAVEFFETQRWGNTPACVHCGSVDVYKMVEAGTGKRNSRFLWRCRDCKEQFTVRIGTVYERIQTAPSSLGLCILESRNIKEGCICAGDKTALPDQL